MFQALLADHPDKELVHDVCSSLHHGVDIGHKGPRKNLCTHNIRSALSNPEVIDATIHKEITSGWSEGPFSEPPFPTFVINSIGVVPKKSGSFRMITDLSRPEDGVNHSIDKEQFSLQYSTIDDAVAVLTKVGKLDIRDAFRLVPVRKDDWPLLGYQ